MAAIYVTVSLLLIIEQIRYYLEGSGSISATVSSILPRIVEELGSVWLEAERNGLGVV